MSQFPRRRGASEHSSRGEEKPLLEVESGKAKDLGEKRLEVASVQGGGLLQITMQSGC